MMYTYVAAVNFRVDTGMLPAVLRLIPLNIELLLKFVLRDVELVRCQDGGLGTQVNI